MSIKTVINDSGIPSKVIPFSSEMLTNNCREDAFQDILVTRMETHNLSYKYVKLHEEFKSLMDQIKNASPEFDKIVSKIDDVVISKEIQLFDAGYKAGMADLMTALTLNYLQITQTELVDREALYEIKKERGSISK